MKNNNRATGEKATACHSSTTINPVSNRWQPIAPALALTALVLISACASSPHFDLLKPGDRIAFIASGSGEHQDSVDIGNKAIGEDASTGAGAGALAGAAWGLTCGPFAIICSPIGALAGAVTGGAAGAIVGSTKGLDGDQINAVETELQHYLKNRNPQTELTDAIKHRVERDWEVVASPADNHIEITLDSLALKSNGKSQLFLTITTSVTLHADIVSGNGKSKTQQFEYVGSPTYIQSWLENKDGYIQNRFNEAYMTLSENIGISLASR